MYEVRQKVIQTANSLEVINFKKPLVYGATSNNTSGRAGTIMNELDQEEREQRQWDIRKQTIQKNKSEFRRLMNANVGQYHTRDKFLTLSFRELVTDIKKADYELEKFFKRLTYKYKKFERLGIRELQERGAIHYHLALFGLPYVPHNELLAIWCKNNPYMDPKTPSGVNIKAMDEGIAHITHYMSGYMLKALEDDDFLKGHKTLIKSRGLIKPKVIGYSDQKMNGYINEKTIKKGLSFIDTQITYYELK